MTEGHDWEKCINQSFQEIGEDLFIQPFKLSRLMILMFLSKMGSQLDFIGLRCIGGWDEGCVKPRISTEREISDDITRRDTFIQKKKLYSLSTDFFLYFSSYIRKTYFFFP